MVKHLLPVPVAAELDTVAGPSPCLGGENPDVLLILDRTTDMGLDGDYVEVSAVI